VSGRPWPSRMAATWVHRKAEEEPTAELLAATATPRGARLGSAQQTEGRPDLP